MPPLPSSLPQSWFLALEAPAPSGAAPSPRREGTVFGFHFAGGSVNSLRPLRAALPDHIGLQLASLPGRGLRMTEPPCTDLATVVRALADGMADTLLRQDGTPEPYLLYGHSMGALLAFEVARALRRRGVPPPQALVVSGARAPQHYGRAPQDYRFNLPRDVFLQFLRGLEGTPPEFFQHPELVDILLPMLRADFEVCETYQYQPEPPFTFPLIVIHGQADTLVGPEGMHPWRIHAGAGFNYHELPGGHFFIQQQWAEIAAVLRTGLTTRGM